MKDEISDAELFSFAREVRAEILTDLGRPEEADAVLAEKDLPGRVLKPATVKPIGVKSVLGMTRSGQPLVYRGPSHGKIVIEVKPQGIGSFGRVASKGRTVKNVLAAIASAKSSGRQPRVPGRKVVPPAGGNATAGFRTTKGMPGPIGK